MSTDTARYLSFVGGRRFEVFVDERSGTVTVDDDPLDIDLAEIGKAEYSVLLGHRSVNMVVEPDAEAGSFLVGDGTRTHEVRVSDERTRGRDAAGERGADDGDGQVVRASMPGIVSQVFAAEGDVVEAGQPLLILEAMKMENEIRADVPGRIATLRVAVGMAVAKGETLVAIEPVEDGTGD